MEQKSPLPARALCALQANACHPIREIPQNLHNLRFPFPHFPDQYALYQLILRDPPGKTPVRAVTCIHKKEEKYLRTMYQLPYFKEQDFETVRAFMKAHPFIVLTGVDANNMPVATQVPVMITEQEGKTILRGHLMRQTDHHKAFIQNPNVLALFTGPHTYVSASWYSDPRQGATWNYMTVQAQGTLHSSTKPPCATSCAKPPPISNKAPIPLAPMIPYPNNTSKNSSKPSWPLRLPLLISKMSLN
nr:FMN-binding negative transcriptional regulator [Paraflavitalea speifideiaquila]